LAGAPVVARWGGPIAFTPQRTPVLAPLPDAPDVIVNAGCSGHGIALGVRVGQLVAEAIVDGVPLPAWGAPPGAPPAWAHTRSGSAQAASFVVALSSASASTSSTVVTG